MFSRNVAADRRHPGVGGPNLVGRSALGRGPSGLSLGPQAIGAPEISKKKAHLLLLVAFACCLLLLLPKLAIFSSNVAAHWRHPGVGGSKHMVVGWPYIGEPFFLGLGSFWGHLGPYWAVLANCGPIFGLHGPIYDHF